MKLTFVAGQVDLTYPATKAGFPYDIWHQANDSGKSEQTDQDRHPSKRDGSCEVSSYSAFGSSVSGIAAVRIPHSGNAMWSAIASLP